MLSDERKGISDIDFVYTVRDLCAVYSKDCQTKRTAQNWFAKFKNGISVLEATLHPNEPFKTDEYLQRKTTSKHSAHKASG